MTKIKIKISHVNQYEKEPQSTGLIQITSIRVPRFIGMTLKPTLNIICYSRHDKGSMFINVFSEMHGKQRHTVRVLTALPPIAVDCQRYRQ